MQYDICLKTTSEAALIAALAPFGLTAQDEAGKTVIQTTSHDHALSYAGRVVSTPAVIDPETGNIITEASYLPGEYAVLRAEESLVKQIMAANMDGVEVLADAPAGCPTFGGWTPLPAVDIQAVKAAACARLNAKRDAIQYSTFTDSHGHGYDVDAKSREKMTGLEAKIANGLVLPDGFTWTGADNVERPHTNTTFLALTTEILLWTSAVHGVCVAAKAAIRDEAVTTLDQVAAIEAGVVWP